MCSTGPGVRLVVQAIRARGCLSRTRRASPPMYPLPPTIPTLANLEFFNDLLHRLVDPVALLARGSVARFAKCFHCGSPTEDDKAVQRSFPDLCSAIGQAGRQKGNGILRAVL